MHINQNDAHVKINNVTNMYSSLGLKQDYANSLENDTKRVIFNLMTICLIQAKVWHYAHMYKNMCWNLLQK